MDAGWRFRGGKRAGFAIIEMLLAVTLFGFLATAMAGAIIYGRSSTAGSGNQAQAQQLAEEGLEAVRNIRDAGYTNLVDGTYGIAQSANTWIFSGSSDVTGIFTRQIVIASVDNTRKTVTSTVTWSTGSVSRQTAVTMRITKWQAPLSGPTMMAYSKTTTTPFYRTWDGANWSAEASANAVVGNINYVVLKSARTRNEAILGTQTSTGAIYTQIWNGSVWSAPVLVGTGNATTRAFDIAYEKATDHAVIVFIPSAASADFAYRTWDGTTLSGATTVTAPPTTGVVNWIAVRQNPLPASNEIAMIMLDASSAVYGMVWTGSAWSTMATATTWDTTASTATKDAIDVEYEQTSGKAMFMWGDSVLTNQNYRTWNGATLSAVTILAIAAQGGLVEWTQLAARPSSNEILYGAQDAAGNLNTRKWSGSAWDTATEHPEHTALGENITSKNFDIVWETFAANAGKAWLMWGDSATVTKKQWSGSAWGAGTVLTSSDDTSFLKLKAIPGTGVIFAGLYEDSTSATQDIWESRLTGGGTTWTAKNTIWAGPTGATPVFFRVDIATP